MAVQGSRECSERGEIGTRNRTPPHDARRAVPGSARARPETIS
jgi:hypothetical protein